MRAVLKIDITRRLNPWWRARRAARRIHTLKASEPAPAPTLRVTVGPELAEQLAVILMPRKADQLETNPERLVTH